MNERSYLSIGDVLTLLQEEFPDVTISKIRFLESRGLLVPERTASGYRKFYEHDVERLRWILRQQRENFLPLKVIKGRLEGLPATEPAVLFDVGQRAEIGPPPNGSQEPVELTSSERGDDQLETVSVAVAAGPSTKESEVTTAPGAEATSLVSTTPRRPAHAAGVVIPRPVASSGFLPRSGNPAGAILPVAPSLRPSSPSVAGSPSSPRAPGSPSVAGSPVAAGATGVEGGRQASASPGARTASSGPEGAGDAGLGAAVYHQETGSPAHPIAAGSVTAPGRPDEPRSGASSAGGVSVPGQAPISESAAPLPPPVPPASSPSVGPGDAGAGELAEGSLTAAELAEATGLTVAAVDELEAFGLIESRSMAGVTCYDESAVLVAHVAAGFAKFGVEARHLRIFKHAAERQASLYSQIVMPLLRQRNPVARKRAAEDLGRLTELGASLQECFVKAAQRDLTGG